MKQIVTNFSNALNIKKNVAAFETATSSLNANRGLTLELVKREIGSEYAGQVLGVIWVIAHPLFLMLLYIFIFAFVFKTKVGGTVEMPLDYTTYLLSGLIPWLSFQQSFTRAPTILTSSANLVKQVVFPLEVLPASSVIISSVILFVGLLIITLYVTVKYSVPPITYLLLPVLIAAQLLAMLGVCYILAALGLFLRDIKDLVRLFSVAGMYLMPVFYLPQWVPNAFKPVLYANPFSYLTWCYQDALYYGRIEHPIAWVIFPLGSLIVFTVGYRTFNWLRPYFGNVI